MRIVVVYWGFGTDREAQVGASVDFCGDSGAGGHSARGSQ